MGSLSHAATSTDDTRDQHHPKQTSLDVGNGDKPEVMKLGGSLLELGKKNKFPQCVLEENEKSRKSLEKTCKMMGGACRLVRKSREEEVDEVLADDVCLSTLFQFAYALARLGQTFAGIKGCKEFVLNKFSIASDAAVGDSEAEFSARVAKSIAAAEKRIADARVNEGGGSKRVRSTKKQETALADQPLTAGGVEAAAQGCNLGTPSKKKTKLSCG